MSQFYVDVGNIPGGVIETINHIGPDATDNFTISSDGTIIITPEVNGIQLGVAEAGLNWVDITGSQILTANTGYFIYGAGTYQLPFPATQGQTIKIVVQTSNAVIIDVLSGQVIRISESVSSVNGTATNSSFGDTLELVFRIATSSWVAVSSPNGNWDLA